ncbi:MAG: nucleotidyltransferase family protein [Xanthobacteraceae bacterium]|nr:nucleotidyltransferase family protein [Xanthobacteraceae bacterium]
MNRQEILDQLRQSEPALRERGVARAALFGSRARGDDRADSDIDIMIEIAPQANIDLFQYVDIKHYLEDLLGARVDVANRDYLKPQIRPRAEREAIYAF